MSYIPDDQRLAEPLTAFLSTIAPVREAMLERLRNRDEWKKEHMDELEELVREIQELEFKLIKLSQETR